MLFTVDEAHALKPTLSEIRELDSEYGIYATIVNLFAFWFFILTTLRSVVISTVIVSLFNQEPDLSVAWKKGDGIGFFLLYLLLSCIPLVGNLINIVAPIAIIIAAFATGSGIASNFAPFVLPIAVAYATTFGLIFFSNCLINLIIKTVCPKIYREIEQLSEMDEASRMFYTSDIKARNAVFKENTDKKAEEEADDSEINSDDYYDETF